MVSSVSSQAYCLKLNSHQSHVTEAFRKLFSDEVLVDCTLSCTGGTIKAHKLVLSACSPYFTSLFSTFTNPYQYPVVILKDMAFADLKSILEYMYHGEVTVSQASLPSVLDAAKSLSVTGLCDVKISNLNTIVKSSSVAKSGAVSAAKKSIKRMRTNSKSDSQEESSVLADESGPDEERVSEKQGQAISADEAPDDVDAKSLVPMDEFEDATPISLSVSAVVEHSSESAASSSPSTSHNTRSSSSVKLSPSAHMKANLRQQRIERMQAQNGGISGGRKMWSDEETRTLVRVWEEESARVWASAGKKTLSLQKLSDLLQNENIDRDISQVEGKIKALKRDYKAVKSERAIPSVQTRMAPYLDKLGIIYSRDDS